ncbi:MAG TPA: nucleotidyl transferase AbiEii/AbiGii toxin family protein, partial [Streptosporangiaceae bacterium]|nr:nucleotidyl transferase AbiEii/AbiGii toxin family protein [Streptosporangiaceae bacterium]
SHNTPAGHAYLSLQALAGREGRNTADIMELYALERLLARLAASRHAGHFILKGGVLLAAYDARRPTRDVDMLAASTSADRAMMAEIFREVASIDLEDGLAYEMADRAPEEIREGGSGVRVSLVAGNLRAERGRHCAVLPGVAGLERSERVAARFADALRVAVRKEHDHPVHLLDGLAAVAAVLQQAGADVPVIACVLVGHHVAE